MSATTLTLLSESALEKAALAIKKLEGCRNWPLWSVNIKLALDHTWEYVEGDQSTPPDKDRSEYPTWSTADRSAHCRIWFALSGKVQESVFHHSKSPASVLYKALKTQYEQSGTSAEFYARQNYNNAKLSDYESVSDFLTALTNLAHLMNKELNSTARRIEEPSPCEQFIPSHLVCTPCRQS